MSKKKVEEKAECNNVMAYHVATTTNLSSYSSDKLTLSLHRRRKGTK
jgi:hypothetical protein